MLGFFDFHRFQTHLTRYLRKYLRLFWSEQVEKRTEMRVYKKTVVKNPVEEFRMNI